MWLCNHFVVPIAFVFLIAGNVWLARRYATLVQKHIKGGMTARYVSLNLLNPGRPKWGEIGRTNANFLLPIDARDKRVFALIRQNYRERAIGCSIVYWLFVMLAWGLLQKSCSA